MKTWTHWKTWREVRDNSERQDRYKTERQGRDTRQRDKQRQDRETSKREETERQYRERRQRDKREKQDRNKTERKLLKDWDKNKIKRGIRLGQNTDKIRDKTMTILTLETHIIASIRLFGLVL